MARQQADRTSEEARLFLGVSIKFFACGEIHKSCDGPLRKKRLVEVRHEEPDMESSFFL